MKKPWNPTTEIPADGESVYVQVNEWSGDLHVDYGVVFYDTDGVMFRRFEKDEYEHWPPSDVFGWIKAQLPEV